MGRTRVLALAVVGLCVVLASACTGPQGARDDEQADAAPLVPEDPGASLQDSPETLRWAIGAPSELVPPLAADQDSLTVVDAVFDGLTRLDADGRPRSGAAVRWTSNQRGDVWTILLRAGATFHDGSPVTAADVAFSWEEGVRRGRIAPHLQDVKGYEELRTGDADELEGLQVRGERLLQILLDRPRADLPVVLAHPSLAPVPADTYRADPEGFAAHPVGNGPFALVEAWTPGQFVRLERAQDWRNGPAPAVDELVYRITDTTTGYVAFQQGRVDIAQVPEGALSDAVATYGESVDGVSGPGVLRGTDAETYFLGMRHGQPPFDEVGVRRALSFALDREAITEQAPDGNAQVARGAAAPSLPGAQASACTTCTHAPTAAEHLFDEHGVTELELWVSSEGGHEAIADEIGDALAEVGVRLRVRSVEFDAFLDAVSSGQAELFRYGWSAEHPTLEDVLVPLLHSRSAGVATGNPGGYASAAVDDLLDEALATPDAEERAELLRQAETLAIGREQALVPVMSTRHRTVVSDRVERFVLDPTGRADVARVRLTATDPDG